MKSFPSGARLGKVIAYVLVILVSVTFGAGILEIALRVNPQLVPSDIPTFPPARRFTPSQNITLDVRRSDGDLFTRMEGYVKPLNPADDRVIAQMHLATDHLGFRNPEPWQNRYDVIALGDSFTYGLAVSTPWPERLAQLTNKSVLNLGWEGVGPLDERDLYLQNGRDKSPQWVVLAFFEGNDLNDAASYAKADPLLVPRVGKYYARLLLGGARNAGVTGMNRQPTPTAEYLYPIHLQVGKSEYEATLFNYYLSWLSANASDLIASQNLRLTGDAFKKIRAELMRSDARLLVVYIPSKEHLLAPAIQDAQMLQKVFRNISAIHLDNNSFLVQSSKNANPADVIHHGDDQESAMAKLTREIGADFLDLTSCLKKKIEQGSMPFYEFDTHWNQTGHDLAAEWMAAYITQGQVCQ